MPREVGEDVVCLVKQLRRGSLQATAEVVDSEGDVRARGGGGVHQAADSLLHRLDQLGIVDGLPR